MSSALSKRKKALRRKRAMTDEQATSLVTAIDNHAMMNKQAIASLKKQVYHDVYSDVYDRFCREQTPEVQGEMMMYFLACLHCEFGWGRERLKRMLHTFNEFADTMQRDGVHSPEIRDMLMTECKFDVVSEYRICDKESREVEENLRMAAV